MNFIADQIRLPPDKPRATEPEKASPRVSHFFRTMISVKYLAPEEARPILLKMSEDLGVDRSDVDYLDDWAKHYWSNTGENERIGCLVDWFSEKAKL